MSEKKSFILYHDQYAPLAGLNFEQKGKLLDALFKFSMGDKVEIDDPVVNMAFAFIATTIERDNQSYERKCLKNKENISKRYASDTENLRPNTNEYDRRFGKISYRDNDNDSDSDSDSDIFKNSPTPLCKRGDCREGEGDEVSPPTGKKKSRPTKNGDTVSALEATIDEFTSDDALRFELHEFRRMRERIRKPLTGRALKLAFAELEKLAPGNATEQVKIVQQSILNSWQGFFPLRDNTAPLPRGQPGTRPTASTQWQKDRQAMEDMAEFALKAWEEIDGEHENHSGGIVENGRALPPANGRTGT